VGGPIITDVAVGETRIGIKIPNRELFYTLCAINEGMNEENRINFRKVVFFDEKDVADPRHPRNGFLRQSTPEQPNGRDCLFDPWERQYCIAIDYTGDGKLKLMYGDFGGVSAPSVPVGVFSLGPDQSLGASGDDVLWQRPYEIGRHYYLALAQRGSELFRSNPTADANC
jgi:hypothetical protein